MKIVIFEAEQWEKDAFSDLGDDHDVIIDGQRLKAAEIEEIDLDALADAEIISTFIYSELDQEVLRRFPKLKLIATRSTGFDHIDLDYCARKDIMVANVPTYGENTVAEHVFALLLAISHHLVTAIDRTRRGDFSPKGLQGFDLRGKTFGIIGTGAIGLHTARIARGFDMDVLAYDIQPDEAVARDIGFRYVEFDELLCSSDVITIHVPASEKTRNLISREAFNAMRTGVVLINTARGSIVDVQALLEALSSGKIAAAGLDVLPEEPVIREEAELLRATFTKEHHLETLLADHILLRLRNVLITPHSAFNTREAKERILKTTHENIMAFLAKKPVNLVSGSRSHQ